MVFRKPIHELDRDIFPGTADLKKDVFIDLRKQIRQKMEGVSASRF